MNKIIKNIYNITDQYFNTTHEPIDMLDDFKFDCGSKSPLPITPLKTTNSQLSIINPKDLLFNDDNNDNNFGKNNIYNDYFLQPNNTPNTLKSNNCNSNDTSSLKSNDNNNDNNHINHQLINIMYELNDVIDTLKNTENKLKHRLYYTVQKQNQLFTNISIICISSIFLQGLTAIIFIKK